MKRFVVLVVAVFAFVLLEGQAAAQCGYGGFGGGGFRGGSGVSIGFGNGGFNRGFGGFGGVGFNRGFGGFGRSVGFSSYRPVYRSYSAPVYSRRVYSGGFSRGCGRW